MIKLTLTGDIPHYQDLLQIESVSGNTGEGALVCTKSGESWKVLQDAEWIREKVEKAYTSHTDWIPGFSLGQLDEYMGDGVFGDEPTRMGRVNRWLGTMDADVSIMSVCNIVRALGEQIDELEALRAPRRNT